MTPIRLLLFAIGLAVPGVALADNDCTALPAQVDPTPVTVNYDPFESSSVKPSFNVEIRTEQCPETRNLFLELATDDPAYLDGQVIKALGPSGDIVEATVTDRSGTHGNGHDNVFNVKVGVVTLELLIERGQVVPPGIYRAPLLAKTRLNNGNNTPEEIAPFDLLIIVGPAVGLAPAMGTQVDLGELSPNDTAATPVTFDAYANVDYELELISDHGFQLVRGGQAGQPAAGYTPILDSTSLPTSDAHSDFARPLGPDGRRRHSLNVRVPSISGLPAGSYEDFLTVEISARLGG